MSFIVAQLTGGLGNQMFQYAAGRSMALRCGVPLKLDLSEYRFHHPNDVVREYELQGFPLATTIADDADRARFGVKPGDRLRPRSVRWRKLLRKLARTNVWPTYTEPHFHFDSVAMTLQPPVYLKGFWQSERYFANCREAIRRDLTPIAALEPENAKYAAQIDAKNAVSLHVRRGDFANLAGSIKFHGTCSLDYYHNAIERLQSKVEAPHFFVFSDDLQWASDNVRSKFPMTFIDANPPDRGYRDMQLMARCRHHILANSTFSWWGAWLNPSPGKVVIAPARWFNNGPGDLHDLIPQGWLII
jgi:hypothetical protein